MQLPDSHVPRERPRRASLLAVACAGVLLAGCAGDSPLGWLGSLPPPPPGPPPAFPAVVAPAEADEARTPVLTDAERKEMEAQLNRLAGDREAALRRRIQQSQ